MRPPLLRTQRLNGHIFRRTFASGQLRVAVLYQALDPPIINGVQKPKKPGGYRDSGADIAYALQEQARIQLAIPAQNTDPAKDADWVFPDHEQGILDAVRAGATCLWANTILFKDHPLQTSSALEPYQGSLRVVGQPPLFVDAYDDKNYVNSMLRKKRGFTLPKSSIISQQDDLGAALARDHITSWPVVAKPIRGRGSHGVKLCPSLADLKQHAERLFSESPSIMVEEYLSGQEATVTVMPPSATRPDYWAMPVVVRFNHVDGIAPYNGAVAVTANSRTVSEKEAADDPAYGALARECEGVGRLLQTKAPIRIDARRFNDKNGSSFALFDINMKPNMTGPGRPGREDQASLTAMAAAGLGWDYSQLLQQILESSCTLEELRTAKPAF
ncbi:putative D-alanine--D-alanine ligase (D-alanylalanine synthetase) (D-ala-D-ala ligase) protein [Botryosphaeria dothidea]|uniref:D-alanine--D-alanine ligase (D-alanylalanine synthetase) (D-ala-D-ala ligase) protein n=1 Tax=Botryosphaeria dothidea TaxID=55169 RepID=A0A8H4J031_9PEZI|nr:putative D-alanine--D-alanine ligase (D-alanylalanine synthetase) (D-ala-D-ala ligase) protein [Botryosphaeria dothidea]